MEACCREEFRGCTLVLQDDDESKLSSVNHLANKRNQVDLNVERFTDVSQALNGADFVILNVSEDGVDSWRKDWAISFKHGVKQVLGRYGGPGGLFHGLRKIHRVMNMVETVEKISPDALVLNTTEPIGRTTLTVSRYTNLKVVGVANGVEEQLKRLASVIGSPVSLLSVKSGGLNNFSWFKELRFIDGSDAYPLLSESVASARGFQPICRAMYDRFGLYPSTDDAHIGEYLAHAWDLIHPSERGLAFIERFEEGEKAKWRKIRDLMEDPETSQSLRLPDGNVISMVAGIISGVESTAMQVNMPNSGQIPNLIRDAVVESPARTTKHGVEPVSIEVLPAGLAALCNIQILIQSLAVEAGVRGEKGIAMQAMLADPVLDENVSAEKLFNELMEVNRDMLPQFKMDPVDLS
jgi:alpha-galactosidase